MGREGKGEREEGKRKGEFVLHVLQQWEEIDAYVVDSSEMI